MHSQLFVFTTEILLARTQHLEINLRFDLNVTFTFS